MLNIEFYKFKEIINDYIKVKGVALYIYVFNDFNELFIFI